MIKKKTARLASETMEAKRQRNAINKVLKAEKLPIYNSVPSRNSLLELKQNKDIFNKQNLRKFPTSRPALKEIINKTLQTKGKQHHIKT